MEPDPREYVSLGFDSKRAYIRRDDVEKLGMVDAVIFDCDGVLIDIRGSYNRAISKSAAYIIECLTGCKMPEKLISDEVIFLFRRSGGFNNDWDTVYGIVMFMLCGLPENARRRLGELAKALSHVKNAAKRLLMIKEKIGVESNKLGLYFTEDLAAKLRDFTSRLDATGVASVDKALLGSGGISEDFYISMKNFLQGSGKIGENVIGRVVEEMFCGPGLFEEIYGVKSEIYDGRGMIENGKPIIRRETLKRLSLLLGDGKLGIASGSKFKSAEHILRDLLASFNPRALVFLDRVEEAERKYAKRGLRVNLRKPNPFSLLEAAKALEPFRFVLYIGDSMEDAMMVDEARKIDRRFLFAGVYEHTGLREKALREFLKYGCNLILPSVNEVPDVIEAIRGGRVEGG